MAMFLGFYLKLQSAICLVKVLLSMCPHDFLFIVLGSKSLPFGYSKSMQIYEGG
jgi:hypothetical protein